MNFPDWVTKEHTLHESIKELFRRIGEMVSFVSLVETHYSEISNKIILYKGMGIDEISPVSVDMYFQAKLMFDGDTFSSIPSAMFPVTFEDLNSGMGKLSIPPESVDIYFTEL